MSGRLKGIEMAIQKSLELPEGKRKPLYRFLEILPGALSYSLVILLFVLSWVNPVLGAIYLLVVVAITFVKAIATAFRTIQGYKAVKQAERVNWHERLEDLDLGSLSSVARLFFLSLPPFFV